MKVSVILPTLNRAGLLRRSAGSVLAQSFRDLELIVVDDGSTEDIAGAIAALNDPRARVVRRPQRGGVAAARNTGVQAARGEWLAFQDSDDEWLLDKLEKQFAALDAAGPEFGMCVGGLLRVGSRVRSYPPGYAGEARELSHVEVLSEATAYTQTWLVRRDALMEAGGFDESLRIWDDWELLVRISKAHKVQILPEAQVISIQGPDGLSADHSRFTHDMGAMLHKHSRHLAAYPAQHAALRYTHGRLLCMDGRLPEARRALAQSLRLEPRRARSWALWAATFAGRDAVERLLRSRNRQSKNT